MAKNSNLTEAKRLKNDEFYTMYEDIAKEVNKYRNQFEDKVIYCNCDDHKQSNFFIYMAQQFTRFKLKKLICSSYNRGAETTKYYTIERAGALENIEDCIYIEEWENYIEEHDLESDGDFRSEASINLLLESDIVITNPPFSLFREYVAQLVKYDKKFLILGNQNAITYKEIFPLIKDNKMWFGYGFNKAMEFIMPDDYELKGKAFIDEREKKHGFVPGISWFTNLETTKRNMRLELCLSYERRDREYPKYDNYDAIEVSKAVEIPYDYDDVIGVPITWLDKFCPTLFEIIQLCASHGKEPRNIENESCYLNGKWVYARILIRRRPEDIEQYRASEEGID